MKLSSNITVVILFIFAAFFKLFMYQQGLRSDRIYSYSIVLNMFLFILAAFFGIRELNRNQQSFTILDGFKTGLRKITLFAILNAFFLYYYYSQLDYDYLIGIQDRMLESAAHSGQNMQQAEENIRRMISPLLMSTMSVFFSIVIGAFFSFALAFLNYKQPRLFKW